MGALWQDAQQTFEVIIGFLDQENIGLAYLFTFLGCVEVKIPQIMYFKSAILNVRNGGFAGVCANGNIDFWIPHALKIPEMYSFTNPQKNPTKKHSEPD